MRTDEEDLVASGVMEETSNPCETYRDQKNTDFNHGTNIVNATEKRISILHI